MENKKIAEIKENFKEKLDAIYESILALGRETTDDILAYGGTNEDIKEITKIYIDRGLIWVDEFMDAFKISEPELKALEEV